MGRRSLGASILARTLSDRRVLLRKTMFGRTAGDPQRALPDSSSGEPQ